ncbi:hypothetical protein NPIL_131681 [Nephila pilipes]|uniref:Uncharacterized protein n=1 Tax=Nephila pilipes TaxID=299642 RepID=A0A8X6ULX4_NEPPI|nr:hypothetical protein NPIL_131681 [Nephila pilipes]
MDLLESSGVKGVSNQSGSPSNIIQASFETTLTSDWYISIQSYRLQPFMSIVPFDGHQQIMRQPIPRELLPSSSRITLLTSDISTGHLNSRTCTVVNITEMPYSVLFRKYLRPYRIPTDL